MTNKPANVQKIRFPNGTQHKRRFIGTRWMYLTLGFIIGLLTFWGGSALFSHRTQKATVAKTQTKQSPGTGKRGYNPYEGTRVSYPGRSIQYARSFNDKNALHLEAAGKVGLKTIPANREAVDDMRDRMVHIRDSRNYLIDPLTHSIPYLCTGAARELETIGEAWADLLERNNLPHYQFILTSVLRTQEDVQKLRKSGNVNAADQSAHCFGTTFDITYTRFEKADKSDMYMVEDNLKLALAQILLNEQRAGHIYVKYENKQACFHITSRL